MRIVCIICICVCYVCVCVCVCTLVSGDPITHVTWLCFRDSDSRRSFRDLIITLQRLRLKTLISWPLLLRFRDSDSRCSFRDLHYYASETQTPDAHFVTLLLCMSLGLWTGWLNSLDTKVNAFVFNKLPVTVTVTVMLQRLRLKTLISLPYYHASETQMKDSFFMILLSWFIVSLTKFDSWWRQRLGPDLSPYSES